MRNLLNFYVWFGSLSAVAAPHPLAPPLECRVHHEPYVTADLHSTVDGKKLGTYGGMSPEGSCEFAIRNARNGVICLGSNYEVNAVELATGKVTQSFGSESEDSYQRCYHAVNREQLATRTGYLDFIAPAALAPFKQRLPQVDDADLQAVLQDSETMWYDERSMVFTYQDSQGSPQGLRANRVGWDVGINTDVPDIHKLVNYFEPEHFQTPFKTAAGTDQVPAGDLYLLNFWHPPKVGGQAVPVRYWQPGDRWRWTFPLGTVFGEVFFMRAPDDGTWHVFEIRTRKRYADGWDVHAYRPFRKASELADAIRRLRPEAQSADVKALLAHLDGPSTLVPHAISGPAYQKIVQPITGYLDVLPDVHDYALVKDLLAKTPFRSAEGTIWKEDGGKETYAPSTDASFSIVPKSYAAGVIQVNEESCERCHRQTGRELGDIEGAVVLYGEIWGEDRVFTWHLFEVGADAFTVSDGSRRLNPRLKQAGLVAEGRPAASDPLYGRPLDPKD